MVGEWLADNVDFTADAHFFVEPGDVDGAHAHASVAGWGSEFVFFGSAVDVNVPAVGTSVMGLKPAQPEDAGDDGVAAGRVNGDDFSGGDAAVEFHSQRLAGAVLFCDCMFSQGGAVTASTGTQPILGGGNFKKTNGVFVFEHGHALVCGTDNDAMPCVCLSAANEE